MKISFYQRVVLLLSGLVVLVQLFNLSAVLTTISQDVRDEMREDVQAASTLVNQLLERRSRLLLTSAEVLAADFGFRSTIVSQDDATILSALANNVGRIDADLATFVTLDGRLISTTKLINGDKAAYQALVDRTDVQGTATATQVIGGYAREVVSVPVKAPLTAGWLVLGFSLDDKIAEALSAQIGMQVTFAENTVDWKYYGSSFSDTIRTAIPAAMRSVHKTNYGLVSSLSQEDFLTRIEPISGNITNLVSVLHTSVDAALVSYRSVRYRLLVFMALSLCVAIVLGLWFARGVTRPVELLSIAASRVRQGEYKAILENSTDSLRRDEFGELLKTFDDMQSGIAEREARITHQAYYDDLTQLPNRRMALSHIKTSIEEHSENLCFGVILLGVNRYKQISETLGYAVGEDLVLALSRRLRLTHSHSYFIARISSDEFVLLLNCTDPLAIQAVVDETIHILETSISLNDAELLPDISAGIVRVPEDASNADDAIRRAGIALTDARDAELTSGFYTEGRDEIHARRLSIVADLKRAVDQNELILHFQPKTNMQNMEVVSVEALVRWIHPEHGFMPPDEFIGLAESSGNIGLLTQWVLNAVIRQLSLWDNEGIHLKAAVNLSALDLQDESLLTRIQNLLEQYKLPASRLILEVTESAMIRDADRALKSLEMMRACGFTISIDDFGTGYSSLAKLKDLPIDELKIDRAFVSDIKPGSTKAIIIKSIIDLGHSMNLTVICEGVETQAEWNLLSELGNDIVQGYFISKPLAADTFTSWWHERYPIDKHSAA